MLRVGTFGGLSVRLEGEPVTGFASRKAEALLVYLACTGRPHSREVLADLLWDDLSQSRAMSNLRVLLSSLRQQVGPYVTITRETAGINPDAELWLDAAEMEKVLAQLPSPTEPIPAGLAAQAAEALALYQGDFLEGFHLRGARGFEEWQTVERERLRLLVLAALRRLVTHHLRLASYHEGIPLARQLLRLDPLDEAVHRRLMRLLAYDDQRAAALAQYETCRQVLADELGLEPTAETAALYEQIQAGNLPSATLRSRGMPEPAVMLPAFLEETGPEPVGERPAFVAREAELARLNDLLEQALTGRPQVAFVVGEAGAGKSALVTEFARRAQETYPQLAVALGNCNAFSGRGDPYLPFRDVMEMLTGGVESRWTTGHVSQVQARLLWALLPRAVAALVEHGPNLLDVFVPGTALLTRAAAALPGGGERLGQLEQLADRQRATPGELEQRQLFEQFAAVLRALAAQQPLLLLLDDLQWADSGSIDLLFHLGRRLDGAPVCILGAYRPEEVALGRDDEAHPLSPVLNEFKRSYGDVWIDLEEARSAEGEVFVNELLDSEPNQLGADFRRALFHRTGGQPLFAVELLRELQERGDLVQDEAGRWFAGAELDWEALPARVEGVIAQRFAQLEPALRQILSLAAVEGEQFTAQVIAQVQGLDERQLIRQLSQLLDRRHRLIQERGVERVNGRRLSIYHFRHHLFQAYLYHSLGQTERELLHEEVGETLEAIYGQAAGQIAALLGWHFQEAGVEEKAAQYLLEAGDRAYRLYSYPEAIAHFQQALALLQRQGATEQAARTTMKLGLVYHLSLDYRSAQNAYAEGFALWQRAAKIPVDMPQTAVPHAFRMPMRDPGTLDPARSILLSSSGIIQQLFAGLVELSPGMNVMPNLARAWEVLEAGRRYRFRLREDVFWSDGLPITAADVAYAWKRVLHPATGSPNADLLYNIRGARAFHQGQTAGQSHIEIG